MLVLMPMLMLMSVSVLMLMLMAMVMSFRRLSRQGPFQIGRNGLIWVSLSGHDSLNSFAGQATSQFTAHAPGN
jgi:hypothetical protein